MTHDYQITGMTCDSCVARVKSELLKLGDIISADVRLNAPQANITMSRHISTPALQAAVARAGNFRIQEAINGESHSPVAVSQPMEHAKSYFPIFLIFGYISVTSLMVQWGQDQFDWMQWMSHFMGGFFLVFSFFKLLDLKGFAEGYRSYDIVANKFRAWGFIYPFIELALAIAFLTGFDLLVTNLVTWVVMSISSVGVIRSLIRKTTFQCACLGTIIKLPLSKVTLFEDLLMVFMSGIMIAATLF